MNLIQALGAVELGLIYGLVAIGVFISFRVLDFPDLTADGSFPLGAAVTAILIVNNVDPWVAALCAIVCGFMSGAFTAYLNVKWGILNLLASILTMTALYSINLRIMGRPNIALLDDNSIFQFLESFNFDESVSTILFILVIVVALVFILFSFFRSEIGLAIRATGANPKMARAQGIPIKGKIILGMAISNGFIALAGSLFAQSQGFADVTMGVGTIIVGLAAVIIGEALFHTRNFMIILIGCIVGSIVYRFAIAFALNAGVLGLQASDLQLVTAMIVGFAMILPKIRSKILKTVKGKSA